MPVERFVLIATTGKNAKMRLFHSLQSTKSARHLFNTLNNRKWDFYLLQNQYRKAIPIK